MTIGMRFDESGAGQIEGVNDAGIETFAGNHLGSLAREQGQNSVDARDQGSGGPVEIRYELIKVKTSEVPGIEDLGVALNRTEQFWNDQARRHDKTLKMVRKAKRLIGEKFISVLKISDRNTSGLRGSANTEFAGDWYALTKASGVSLKGEGQLGSFGIGKNVFWLNSGLRTVYFSTHDVEDRWAFQGVTKLASHILPNGKISRAIGFHGLKEGFRPILGKENIPARFRADGTGTDIFVAGFDDAQDWKEELIAAFAENFFVAFQQDLLQVRIEEHEIFSANIGDIIKGLATRDPDRFMDTLNFYDALTSASAREFSREFESLGMVKLRLLLRDGARKRIAMFRGTGMKIFERGSFRTPMEFAGVFQCIDKKGNEFLRQLEPPSHNTWEAERYGDDPKMAKGVIKNLMGWLHDCVRLLSPEQAAVALDIPGLERFLPDEEDTEPLDGEPATAEGDPRHSEEIVLDGRTRQEKPPAVAEEESQGEDSGLDDEGVGVGAGEEDGDGTGGIPNASDGGDDHSGSGASAEEASGVEDRTVKYRIFKRPGSGMSYVMRAEMSVAGIYSFAVYAVGDDGASEPAEPKEPICILGQGRTTALAVSNPNRIGRVDVRNPGPVELEFKLASAVPLTLNAKVFRHG